MSFNGSGSFVINSAGQPVVANTLIESAKFNLLTADLATGLSTCLLKDGTQTVTANIPLGGFKITGLGAGTALTDAASLANLIGSTGSYVATVGGTANAITLTPSPAITAYAAGQTFIFQAASTNTSTVTMAVSGLTTKAIQQHGQALVAGSIRASMWYRIFYDGTAFQLESLAPHLPLYTYDCEQFATFAAAITAIGSTVATLVISQSETVGANVTVPATLTLHFIGQGALSVSNTFTVTINGPVVAVPRQIFSGLGTVVPGTGSVWQEMWVNYWGCARDGATNDSAAWQAAINAAKVNEGTVRYLDGVYAISTALTYAPSGQRTITFEGVSRPMRGGQSGGILKWTGASGATMLTIESANNVLINKLSLDGNDLALRCLFIDYVTVAHGATLRNLEIYRPTGTNSAGIQLGDGNDAVSEIYMEDVGIHGASSFATTYGIVTSRANVKNFSLSKFWIANCANNVSWGRQHLGESHSGFFHLLDGLFTEGQVDVWSDASDGELGLHIEDVDSEGSQRLLSSAQSAFTAPNKITLDHVTFTSGNVPADDKLINLGTVQLAILNCNFINTRTGSSLPRISMQIPNGLGSPSSIMSFGSNYLNATNYIPIYDTANALWATRATLRTTKHLVSSLGDQGGNTAGVATVMLTPIQPYTAVGDPSLYSLHHKLLPIGVLYQLNTTRTTAGTSEETLATFTVLANTMDNASDVIRLRARGVLAANGNSKEIKITDGATTIYTLTTTGNNVAWSIDVEKFQDSGAGARAFYTVVVGTTVTAMAIVTAAAVSADQALALKSTTATAAGDVTLRVFQITYEPSSGNS